MGGTHIDVDAFIEALRHPMAELIQALRALVAAAAPELREGIKWNAPSFALEGNDIVTLQLHGAEAIGLVFHTGPKGKDTHSGAHPIELPPALSACAAWPADKRALLRFSTLGELEACREALGDFVRAWTELARRGFP